MADILTAVRGKRMIRFENKSSRSGQVSTLSGVPLKIFVSTQTGRRYLCLYLPGAPPLQQLPPGFHHPGDPSGAMCIL